MELCDLIEARYRVSLMFKCLAEAGHLANISVEIQEGVATILCPGQTTHTLGLLEATGGPWGGVSEVGKGSGSLGKPLEQFRVEKSQDG